MKIRKNFCTYHVFHKVQIENLKKKSLQLCISCEEVKIFLAGLVYDILKGDGRKYISV